MGSYSLENGTKINPNLQQVQEPTNEISESVSEASKRPLKTAEPSEEYNIPSNQNEAQNRVNFITLGNLSEEKMKDKIIKKSEIIYHSSFKILKF